MTLVVTSDRPGTLYADGVVLGRSEGRLATSLPAGAYRLWLDYGAGWSLPHPVIVAAPRTEVQIDTDLDARTSLGEAVALRCTTGCKSDLAELAARVGAARVYGIRGKDGGAGEVVAFDAVRGEGRTGAFSERRGLELDAPTAPSGYPRWSALYLVPFGGGQLVQHRRALGAVYGVAQVGLLGWHVTSRVRFARESDPVRQEAIRGQANLSLGLLAGALAASVLEAVVVGQLAGE